MVQLLIPMKRGGWEGGRVLARPGPLRRHLRFQDPREIRGNGSSLCATTSYDPIQSGLTKMGEGDQRVPRKNRLAL